jgi:excisionase family DNA binding protein
MSSENRARRIAALFTELAELISSVERPEVPAPRVSTEHILLTVEEVAERLNIGRTRVFALIKSGEIESVTIGRLRRIRPDAIETFMRRARTDSPDGK